LVLSVQTPIVDTGYRDVFVTEVLRECLELFLRGVKAVQPPDLHRSQRVRIEVWQPGLARSSKDFANGLARCPTTTDEPIVVKLAVFATTIDECREHRVGRTPSMIPDEFLAPLTKDVDC